MPSIPNALHADPEHPMTLFGTDYPTADGTCVRDYIHVDDLASAHLLALAAIEPGVHHVVNLGSGTGYSVREVLSAIETVTGTPVPVQEAGRRAGDPPTLIASNERASRLLGWTPTLGLEDMIRDAWTFERDRAEPAG